MKRSASSLLLLVIGIGLAGRTALAEKPVRIVSMNPSLTAILVAIGARDRLVGVDDFSAQQQAAVAALPRVGGFYNPSLEAVVGLQPDLVTLVPSAEQRDFRDRLAELEIPVLALDPISFEDVLETIVSLGERVGHTLQALERVAEIRRVRERTSRSAAGRARVRTVLVLQREPLFVVGRGSFVDDMLATSGAENLAAGFETPYPRVSLEWLIAAAPDVLLDASRKGEPAERYWARWPSLPAVAAGRAVDLPSGVATLPGPYLDRGLEALFAALHEESPVGNE